jgi:hypothetical protein
MTRKLDCDDQMYLKDAGKAIKCAFRYQTCSQFHARVSYVYDFHFRNAWIDHAKGAESDGGVDERAEERRAEMLEGIMEGGFRTGDLVSYCWAFSRMEVPCTAIC